MVNSSRLVQTFLDLAQIDSLTFDEKRVAQYIAGQLKEMGLKVTIDQAGEKVGSNTGNVIAVLSGDPSARAILLNAHMDTVAPGQGIKPHFDGQRIRSDGQTILGADDKAGVAIILEIFRVILETGIPHGEIEAVFTIAEEKGLFGSKNLNLSSLKAQYAYVLDGEGPAGRIVTQAPSQNSIKAVFYGKAAHAGVEPEKGINAIQAASQAVSKMRLGRLDLETTANIGVIKGGSASNIVPAKAEIEGEARSLSEEKLKAQTDHLCQCIEEASQAIGTKVEINLSRSYDAFHLTERDEVVKIALEAAGRMGLEPKLISSGGGSDTNLFNKAGISAVNLSVGYANVHTTEEEISISDLEKAANFALEIAKVAWDGIF